MNNTQENTPKNSKAKIRANNRYAQKTYKNINIKIKPEEAENIRNIADKHGLSIARLIVEAVRLFESVQP